MQRRNRIFAWLGALSLLAAGCAHYSERPLDLDAHARAWADRSPSDATVVAYAERLAIEVPGRAGFDPEDGLDLEEAEAVALLFHPGLRVARAEAGVPRVSAEEAGWWDDPVFEAQVLRFLDRGRRGDSDHVDDPWILDASLAFTIPLSGRVAAERDRAWAESDAAVWGIVAEEARVLEEVRRAWLDWSSIREEVDLTREYLGRLEEVAHTADRLVEAGELKPTEARLLRIETARRRGDLQRLEGELEIRRRDVFALLGLSPDAPVELRGRMSVPEIVVADESREDWLLRRHPRIRRVRAEYRSAEERLRLEIRRQYPDLAIGPSFSLEEGFSRLGLGLALPLPLWNRNRRGIAEATAGREAARVRAEAETERLLGDLGLAEARLESARRQRGYLVAQVAPLVDRQVSETRTLLDLGEVDVLVLRDALSTSLETKLEIVEATRAESVAANAVYSLLSPRWAVADEADGKDDAR